MAYFRHIPELIVPGHRLGRHVHRPDDFEARTLAAPTQDITNIQWNRHCAPFNQGDVGSCTGNASAGALMTAPFWVPGRNFGEPNALNFYGDATHYNPPPPDYYPPNDVGSSGPAVAEALANHKPTPLISDYVHATNLQSALGGLMSSPGIFGVSWFTSFDSPLSTGECPLTAGATVRGGHEIEAFMVDNEHGRVFFYQSWGANWGGYGNGVFWFSYQTLTELFDQEGDATFFTPPVTPAASGK